MKRVSLLVAVLCAVTLGRAQLRYFTEYNYDNNKYYSAATAAAGDTIIKVIGAQTPPYQTAYLIGLELNTITANEVITIWDGTTVFATITFGASPPTNPVFIPYNANFQTCLVYKQTQSSKVTVVYRGQPSGPPVNLNVYFVDARAGWDGNDGHDPERAWRTVAKVNGSTFVADNQILFRSGVTWMEQLTPPNAGLTGHPIIFGRYGTGPKPIITIRDSLKNAKIAGSWRQAATTIWAINDAFITNLARIWLDGIEYGKATSAGVVDATYRWFYNHAVNDSIYVYASANPSTIYTTIEVPASEVTNKLWTVTWADKGNITFDGIDFQGGGNGTITFGGSHHVTFQNCNIGLYCNNEGLYIDNTLGAVTTSDSGLVTNCTFNSGATIAYPDQARDQTGAGDAIALRRGSVLWSITGNSFVGWFHSGVYLFADATAPHKVWYNTILNNTFDGGGITYARAYACAGSAAGYVTYNTFAYNTINRMTIGTQIGGDTNAVYYNLVNTMSDPNAHTPAALSLEPMFDPASGTGWCKGNSIFNNTIFYGPTYGIKEGDYNAAISNIVAGNYIENNIVVDATSAASTWGFALNSHTAFVTGTVVKNNIFFNPNRVNYVTYRETIMSVATLNTQNTNGDIISGNLAVDPMFVSAGINFFLLTGSPAISAGLPVGLSRDILGFPVSGGAPDLGAYEYHFP